MKVLVVGVSTRSIAESAVRSGYQVVAVDAFGDYDLKALCDSYSLRRDFEIPFSAAGLYSASRRLTFDAVAYTSNLENHPEVVRRFARRTPILGNSPEVLKRVRTWASLFAVLNQAGYMVPETIFHGNGRRADPDRQWLRKPVRSGGGHGITFTQSNRPASRGYLFQEYVPGLICSAAFVANQKDAVVIGVTEQLVGRSEFGTNGFRYCGNILPLEAARSPDSGEDILVQVQQIAALISREFALTGVNGFDFILTDGRVCLTEVNPRYSASMELVERAYGLSIFDLHVKAVTQGALPDFNLIHAVGQPGQESYGKAILYAKADGLAPDTQSWLQHDIHDVPFPGESLVEGKPICTLLAAGGSRDKCFAHLVDRAKAITGEIYA